MTVLSIDLGNTRAKLGVYKDGSLIQTRILSSLQLNSLKKDYPNSKVAVSNVSKKEHIHLLKKNFRDDFFELTYSVRLPFEMCYDTPDTLGKDRISNAAALVDFSIDKPKLCIDIGTCIKFDFVDQNNRYFGGSISPGLRLRLAALNQKTENLPNLDFKVPSNFIGANTNQSILSGVYFGMLNEIEGMIDMYLGKYPEMNIIITGGDAIHFDFNQKYSIFADENFTLKGIYQIYLLNEK